MLNPKSTNGRPDWAALHGETFGGRRAVVTGGAGFIGLHLAEALLELGAAVTVIDDLSGSDGVSARRLALATGDRLRFVEASVLDRGALADAVDGAQLVFHQAALGSVPRSVEQPRAYHEANATGTLNVLEAARAAGVARVMFAASSSAYGDGEVMPKVETLPSLPLSPYAATKVAGEALMRAYAHSYPDGEQDGEQNGEGDGDGNGLDTVSLRYFNIFGPRQNANSAYAAVIAAFATTLLEDRRPVIYGDGEQSRDFTHVDNAVHANLLAARAPGRLGGEVFNVACGVRVTVNELAARLAEALGCPQLTAGTPAGPGGRRAALPGGSEPGADGAELRADCGFCPGTGGDGGVVRGGGPIASADAIDHGRSLHLVFAPPPKSKAPRF